MKRLSVAVFLTSCLLIIPALSQTQQDPPPQSARQALIEMVLGKGPDDFAKHLPDETRKVLIRKGETSDTSTVLKIAETLREMSNSGQHVETFDTGSTIMFTQLNEGREKIEIVVEHDSLMGENEEIELSIHYYKDGQPQMLPVLPSLIFTMQQQEKVWRLTALTASAHVPLTDQDYLKGLRKEADDSLEQAARQRLFGIVSAEKDYATRHPEAGFICTMATLFAPDPAQIANQSVPVYSSNMADTESNGYRYALTGCSGTPAGKYRVTAVAIDPDSGLKTYCADEAGTLKSSTDPKPSRCFSQGQSEGSMFPQVSSPTD